MKGHSDFCGYSTSLTVSEVEAIQERQSRFSDLATPVLAEYLVRLLRESDRRMSVIKPAELAEAIWFIFGVGSGFVCRVLHEAAASEHVRLYEAIRCCYEDTLDRLCNRRGASREDMSNTDRLDVAVYMIWDMDSGLGFVPRNASGPVECSELALDTLDFVLSHCRSGSCLKSALHGLGHLEHYQRQRVHAIIDGFLAVRSDLPTWLTSYAGYARSGSVQ
ncbi:hypothetical protein PHYC_02240 [Phycisphaerales bacterium]|nr:hypothetical protein PHYC_02240 [Phycisphaerales bacterium]